MSQEGMKVCTRCKEVKPLSDFWANSTYADGISGICKFCLEIPPDKIDVSDFIARTKRLSNAELGQFYGVSRSTIARWKTGLRRSGHTLGTVFPSGVMPKVKREEAKRNNDEIITKTVFPKSKTPDYTKYELIQEERVMIIGDVEIPDHDAEILELAYNVAVKFNIRTLVINGDLMAIDSFSKWARDMASEPDFVEDEYLPTQEILTLFLRHFDRIIWNSGNHERRIQHFVEGRFSLGFFFRGLFGVTFSEYPFCVVESGGEKILVCHQDNFSKIQLSVPEELASIYLMNVICGHNHRLAFGYHRSGQYWVMEGGYCRDRNKTRYKAMRINRHAQWNPGFVIIVDGMGYPIAPGKRYNFFMNELTREQTEIEPKADEEPTRIVPAEVETAEETLRRWREFNEAMLNDQRKS